LFRLSLNVNARIIVFGYLYHQVDLDRMNQESLLAFFLNIFNCLYMHTLVVSDLVHDSNNKTKRLAFMRRVAYTIGPSSSSSSSSSSASSLSSSPLSSFASPLAAATYSLQDIKYGVLRAAMPFPEMTQVRRALRMAGSCMR
jgi:hypothetical protein